MAVAGNIQTLQGCLESYKKIADSKVRYGGWTAASEIFFSAVAVLLASFGWLNAAAIGVLGLTAAEGGAVALLAQALVNVREKISVLKHERYDNGVFYELMKTRISNLTFIADERRGAEFLSIARALSDWCKQKVPEKLTGNCLSVQ